MELRHALLGYRIAYSLSPRIFELIYEISGVTGKYEMIDCPPDDLANCETSLRRFDGFSVTIPHKEKIMDMLDNIDSTAGAIGAVNSVANEDGKLKGYNTDWVGFLAPLKRNRRKYERVLIAGYGGAARAIIWAIYNEYPEAGLTVAGRSIDKINKFLDSLDFIHDRKVLTGISKSAIALDAAYDLIINCTPLGGPKEPGLSPLPDGYAFNNCKACYDLNYNPATTGLMKAASEKDCEIVNGLEMLATQAMASFNIWMHEDYNVREIVPEILARINNGVKS